MRVAAVFAPLVAAASASPLTQFLVANPTNSTSEYSWNVTNWSAGCADNGCYYDFNVSGAASTAKPPRPAFLAYCSGGVEGAPYQACKLLDEGTADRRVAAELLPAIRNGTSTIARIQISFEYTDLVTSTTWWNFTGDGNATYNQVSAPPATFSITPDTIIGVA